MSTSKYVSDETMTALEQRHGRRWSEAPEYTVFLRAKWMCNSPQSSNYRTVGGLGIKFCYNNVEELLADVGFRPTDRHVLERIDLAKNYEPGNLRWVLANRNRPDRHADRSLDALMTVIVKFVARNNGKVLRRKLITNNRTSGWTRQHFDQAFDRLTSMGLLHTSVEGRTIYIVKGPAPPGNISIFLPKGKPRNREGERRNLTVESYIACAIRTLERYGGEMIRLEFYRNSRAYLWGKDISQQAIDQMIAAGQIEFLTTKKTFLEYDGTKKKVPDDLGVRMMRNVTREITTVKLKTKGETHGTT